jgi:Ca-activated chloride channel family protein
MNRRSAVRKLVAAGAGSLFAGWPAAPQKSQLGDYTLRSDVVLVLLDVGVKDSEGRFIPGLSKDNFTVLEDGRPQKITVFDSTDRPVTVGILVDQSRSMTPKWRDVLTAAQTFIEESNRQDEVFVLHFNDRVMPGLPRNVPFSDDIKQLRVALTSGVPDGKTALNDAVIEGLQHLRLGRRDKKVLVLISDGGDTTSEHKRGDTLAMVERGLATIYTIGLYDATDPDHDPSFLRRLARISGGEAYFPASSPEMVPLCRRIAKEIRTRYTIGYLPEARRGAKSVRHIHVLAGAPGHARLRVRARTSYRYDEVESGK